VGLCVVGEPPECRCDPLSLVFPQQPNLIGCLGSCRALLAVAADSIKLLDTRTDYFARSLPRPEFPVLAEAANVEWKGRIVALSAGIVHDAYVGMTGYRFPGIEAADNDTFARNLLRAMSHGVSAEAPPDWADAFKHVDEIERALGRTTEAVLAD
jgi:hypothetical protein